MSEVLLLLGGNVGNKHKIFSESLELIRKQVGPIVSVSSIYETEPWGFVSDLFWNQAIQVETQMKPEPLLNALLQIENAMGRKRISEEYEARPIDIDIMFYDDLIINTDRLTIPHPLIGLRQFVLTPLNEIIPEKIHPVTGLKISEMLRTCPDTLKVLRING